MALIKDIYSVSFYQTIADEFQRVDSNFNKQLFIKRIFDTDFANMEWKQRMKHSTSVLHESLPGHFPTAASQICQVIQHLIDHGVAGGLEYAIFPNYIESYGLNDFDTAIRSFEAITKFISCEFAVRPFIIRYHSRMIAEMEKWSRDPHPQLRRLASEGSRPRLPWAMAIPFLKKDPTPLLPILENLKDDLAETVRRSVANNLNDISKDHPDFVLGIARRWKDYSIHTNGIIKHGCRTLLKQGNPEILHFYGLKSSDFTVSQLTIQTPIVKIGEQVVFSFRIENKSGQSRLLRLEYAVYYKKLNAKLSKKVFKISERTYAAAETNSILRRQSFKQITTRKFHLGKHKLSIIVNGREMGEIDFELVP